jgi:hypothetical protein
MKAVNMSEGNAKSLEPQLIEAKQTLETALGEACTADVENANTGELIRIEETLAVANEAAKEAVSIRLRMRRERGSSKRKGSDPRQPDNAIPHRVFDDEEATRWHVFAVRRASDSPERAQLPEAYRTGWLVFESAGELRRIAPIPDHWEDFSVDELRQLCHDAASAPRRTPPLENGGETELR